MPENPLPPPPSLVAALCLQAAWDDGTDDDLRLVLEFAHDTIMALMDRTMRVAKQLELAEAKST